MSFFLYIHLENVMIFIFYFFAKQPLKTCLNFKIVCTMHCMYRALYVPCTVRTVHCMYRALYVPCTVYTVHCMKTNLHNQLYIHKVCSSYVSKSPTPFGTTQMPSSGSSFSSHHKAAKMFRCIVSG